MKKKAHKKIVVRLEQLINGNGNYALEVSEKTKVIVTSEMLPHDYLDYIRKVIKDFYLSDNIELIIYTLSDFVIRELSNMIIAYHVPMRKLAKCLEKNNVNIDAKYYKINPKYIKASRLGKEFKIFPNGIHSEILDVGIDNQNELQGELYELAIAHNRKDKE